MSARHDDEAGLVAAARAGDAAAFTILFRRWFDPCSDVARRILHDEGSAAEVAQEVFLVAWRQLETLHDPAAFGGWVLRMARNKALNRAAHDGRSRATAPDSFVLANLDAPDDLESGALDPMSHLEHRELLEAASAVLGERDASVLDLHLRHGLDGAELAEELGVSANNAHQILFRMRKNLRAGVRAWVLYRGGSAACEPLGRELAAAGVTTFGRPAVSVIDRHVEGCEDCDRRRAALLAPEAMFSVAPIVLVAPALREQVVEALRSDGVPLSADAVEPPVQDLAEHDASHDAERTGGADDSPRGGRRGPVLAGTAAVLVLVVGAWWALGRGADGDVVLATDAELTAASSTTSTSTASTSTSTTSSTTTSVAVATIEGAAVPPAADAPREGTPGGGTPRSGRPPSPSPAAPSPPGFVPTPPAAPPSTPATPTTAVAPSAPTVADFEVDQSMLADAAPCGAPTPFRTGFTWSTTGATTVTITWTGGTTGPLGPSGTTAVCRNTPSPPPGGWTLTATGPGGSTTTTN